MTFTTFTPKVTRRDTYSATINDLVIGTDLYKLAKSNRSPIDAEHPMTFVAKVTGTRNENGYPEWELTYASGQKFWQTCANFDLPFFVVDQAIDPLAKLQATLNAYETMMGGEPKL